MSPWLQAIVGWGVLAVLMSVLWLIQWRSRDAGIVDVFWALGVGGLSIFFASVSDGEMNRRVVVALLGSLWALRLGSYLFARVQRMPEDGRYVTLREEWGARAQLNFFVFFQMQAFWSVLFALAMLIACQSFAPLSWLDAIGGAIWGLSLIGESVADHQLARFRADPANLGQVCRVGLWNYSRHPNYFFEWLHWWSYVFIGWSAPFGWLTVFAPLLMLFFLFRVTGIPPTEARALVSRGALYREYQETTSAFVPWPPKRAGLEKVCSSIESSG